MSVIRFEKPSEESIRYIADNMRQADINEVWASTNQTPLDAIRTGLDLPGFSTVVWIDDEPCVIFGLVIQDVLTGTGVPWLLGANSILKHKSQLLKQSPAVIEKMLNICPKLYNYVHLKNEVSIRWLEWLGFSFDDPEPFGIENELFCKFYLERN